MRAVVAVVAIAVAAFAATAHGQPASDPLDQAHALEATLDYDGALAIVDRALARGVATTPARVVELELLAGKLAAGLDRADVARGHFAHVLALAPDTRLPDGTSPKLTAPFEAARTATVPLRIELRRDADAIVASVGPDPSGLFAGLRARVDGREIVARGTRIQIPNRVVDAIDAIDTHGNVIAVLAAPSPSPAPAAAPPVYARWTTWAIAAGGALAIAGTCAWRFSAAQDQWNTLEADGDHGYTELASVEARGRDWAIAADVGFAVAASAAVAALVVLAIHRDAPPPLAASARTIGLVVRF